MELENLNIPELEIPRSKDELWNGDAYYRALREPKYKRLRIGSFTPLNPRGSSGNLRALTRVQEHPDFGRIDALVRLDDVDLEALAERYSLTVSDLLAYYALIRGGPLPPTVGEWAKGHTVVLSDYLILPDDYVKPHLLRHELSEAAPIWVDMALSRVRLAPARGPSSLPRSLLRLVDNKLQLVSPRRRSKLYLEACLWLKRYITARKVKS
ncbi:hypothetical protein [Meiothermus granaticius]|uniref:Uncharacterized protein n=1 Tax=Meiothermus granaticius NBRC 107808 TaxID=1227551 RepID=A0A399FFF3_9DEIN|nr:hypothetical protein [Meiothermus granaticius]RIH94012.1 hypothetical protein Mgrana_00098 [Meiothermus granaticius NBRC 107808]GEM88159.1 hypothetical protein MGR01S_27840 [Meiothermus granaticius NBRC 107808]